MPGRTTAADARDLLACGIIKQSEYDIIAKADQIKRKIDSVKTVGRVVETAKVLGKRHKPCETMRADSPKRHRRPTCFDSSLPEPAAQNLTLVRGRNPPKESWLDVGINHIRRAFSSIDYNTQVYNEHEAVKKRKLSSSPNSFTAESPDDALDTLNSTREMPANISPTKRGNGHERCQCDGEQYLQMQLLRNALPCLAAVPRPVLQHIVANGRGFSTVSYQETETIVEKGQAEQAAYVVFKGKVNVTVEVNGSRQQHEYGTGNAFGYNSLLTGEQQSITAVANTAVTVLVVRKCCTHASTFNRPICNCSR
jgi:hypothetical protein